MKHLRNFLFAAAALVAAFAFPADRARAQTGCSYIATGAVLTAAQWNSCFAQKQNTLGYVPVNKAGDIMLGKLVMAASATTGAGINLPQGSEPTSPNNGDVWTTLSGMYVRINGRTIGPLAGANSTAFGATAPISVSFPAYVVTYGLNTDANFSIVANNLALASGGVAYPSSVTGGAKGAGTINASGLYVNGTAVAAGGIAGLTGDVVATGPGSVTATIQANVVTYSKFQQVAASSLVGNPTGALANAQDITLGATLAFSGTSLRTGAGTGDVSWSANSFATTLATVNSNVGAWGSATQAPQFTVNGKGLVTAAANVTITPAVGSITGLGTGVATALGINVGSAGAVVVNGGALGTPSSGIATNLTGTAAGLTAGTVTTNANLTGDVTSSGNATTIANNVVLNAKLATAAAYTFKGNATGSTANVQDFTIAGLTNKAAPTGSDLLIIADVASSNATKYCTLSQCLGAVTSGVSSLNSLTGSLTIANGNGIAAIGAVSTTITVSADIASNSQTYAGTANKLLDAATAASAATPIVLTPGTTVTPDFNAGINFTLSPVQNFTLANPSNVSGKVGRSFCLATTQDTTPRTITWGSNYYAAGGTSGVTLSTASGALDTFCMYVYSTTQIFVFPAKAFSH